MHGLSAAVSSRGFRRSRWCTPLPNNNGQTSGGTDVVYARPIGPLPLDAKDMRLRIGNLAFDGGRGNSVSTDVAVYQSDGSGNATGVPLAKWVSQSIPGDGTMWSSPTSFHPVLGSDRCVVVVYGFPANTGCTTVGQCNYGTYSLGTLTVDPAPSPSAADPNPVFWIHADYLTRAPRALFVGDSITAACVATVGYSTGYSNLVARDRGWAVTTLCLPGGTLGQFADPAANPLLWDGIVDGTIDYMGISYGVNDLNSGSAAMFTALTTIVALARARGVRRIFGRTVAPQVSYPGTETDRLAYNSLIAANSLNLQGYYDAAAAQPTGLADNIDTTILYIPNSADGTHTSDTGQDSEHSGWLRVLRP